MHKIIVDSDKLRELHAAGLSDGEIGKTLNVSRAVIARNRVELGLPAQDKSMQASRAGKRGGKSAQAGVAERKAAQQEIARKMHAEGKPTREIAQVLEVSTSRVSQILRDMGIRTAAPRPAPAFRVSQKTAPKPNNGAALRQVRINIIRDTWERVVARYTQHQHGPGLPVSAD